MRTKRQSSVSSVRSGFSPGAGTPSLYPRRADTVFVIWTASSGRGLFASDVSTRVEMSTEVMPEMALFRPSVTMPPAMPAALTPVDSCCPGGGWAPKLPSDEPKRIRERISSWEREWPGAEGRLPEATRPEKSA